jgi:hypothetical protein
MPRAIRLGVIRNSPMVYRENTVIQGKHQAIGTPVNGGPSPDTDPENRLTSTLPSLP